MTCLSVVSLALAVLCTTIFQVQAGWYEDFKECTSKFNISNSDIELLNQRKTPSTTDGKCVLACLMKKVGLMNENGQFSADYLKTMAPHVHMGNQQQISMVQTLADGCSAEIPKALDECETAAKIDECIARKGKELGLVSPPPPPPPPPMG